MATERQEKQGEEKSTCACPYCDGAIDMAAPWCAVCEVVVSFCGTCEEPLPADATECPNCGAECEV